MIMHCILIAITQKQFLNWFNFSMLSSVEYVDNESRKANVWVVGTIFFKFY